MTGSKELSVTTVEREPGLVLTWGRRGTGDSGDRSLAIVPDRTPALRFNSDRGVRYRPERLAEIPDNAARIERLRDELIRTLDIFAKHPRQFVEIYFRFIAQRVDAERAALDRALAWSGGLFGADDWIFSALRPLPRAMVLESEGQQNAAARVYDFAFWTGREVLAIDLRGDSHRPRDRDEPTASLVRKIPIPVEGLASGTDIFAADGFPAEFSSFWTGENVPSSPFRPVGLTQAPDRENP